MANFFDQFDEASTGRSSQQPSANFFDQFDKPSVGQGETAEQKTNKLSTTERFAKGAIGGTIGGVENIISLIDKSGVADKDKIKLLGDLAAGTRNIFGVGPQDYKPAGATAWDSSKPVMDRVVEAPRAMVEAAAPAAIGAMVGPLTAAGVVGATTLAPNIDRVREIDKTDPNAPLTTGQMARVGANTGLQMLLGGAGSKITFGRAPVQTVGARGVVDATKGLAATAIKDAGLGAVGVAGDKAIMEGTTPSVDDLAVGAVAGGSGGLIGGARPALREAATAVKYRKTANLPQDSLTRTSNALKDAVDNTPTGTNLDPVSSVESTLKTNTKNASGALKQIISDDIATNGSDSITPLIRTLETKLNNGEKLDPQAFADLKQKIGGNAEGDAFLNTLIDRDTFNQQKGYYGKGLSNTFVGKQLDPTQSGVNAAKVAGWGMLWNLFKGKLPGLPELAYTAAEGIGNVAMRGVDRMTGAADPTQVFIDKFAGRDLADTSGTKPYDSPVKALRAELMAQKLADKAEAERQKQIGKKVADYQKRTLGALSDLDKQDAKVAADKQKANTKTISDFQKMAVKMLGDVSFMPESERFNSELYSDPVNPTLLKMAQKWPGSRDLGQRDFSGSLEEVAARYGDTKLLDELQASTAGQAENAKLEQLLAQERAMRAQGINQNSMPLPPSARSAQIAAAVERQLRERTANAAPPEMPPTTSGSPFDAKLAALAARRANPPPPAPAPSPESPMMASRKRLQEQLDAQASRPLPDRAGLFPELPEPTKAPLKAAMDEGAQSETSRSPIADTFKVKTKEGVKELSTETTYSSEEARAAGTKKRANKRANVWKGLDRVEGLQTGTRSLLTKNGKSWLSEIADHDNRESAMETAQRVLSKLAKKDREKIISHLEDNGFFKTWKWVDANDVARAKVRATKAAEAKKQAEQED